MPRRSIARLSALMLLMSLIAAASDTTPAAPAGPARPPTAGGDDVAPGGDLEKLVQIYAADRASLDQFYDLTWSEERLERLERFYREQLAHFATIDFDALGQQGRIDYLLLRNQLTVELARLARQRGKLAEMTELLPFRRAVIDLAIARRRIEPVDPQAAAARIAELPEQIKQVRQRIDQGKQTPTTQPTAAAEEEPSHTGPLAVRPDVALRAAGAVDGLHAALDDWYSAYAGYLPGFSWWARKPHEEAAAALGDYAKYLRESIVGIHGGDDDPLVGEALGAPALSEELAAEMLPYTPEELIAIGERKFAWCKAEMKKAAADMGCGDDWHAALDKVKNDYVPPGEADALVAADARAAIRFLNDHNLLTIPPLCEETWRLNMISAETQKVLPYAAYSGQTILVAYATDDMRYQDRLMSMRGNNRQFSRTSALHELIPGHHMQAFMSQRYRPYRQMFGTPFYVEGWSLYWEMTFFQLGYARTPEERIGMLFWLMHRSARVTLSLKYHLGQITPPEMVDFLVQQVGHERFGAVSEVRRYIEAGYAPLYQCGYMVGGLQFRALRKELVNSGKMAERAFNDALLTEGPIAVELIRAALLNEPLTPQTQAGWRFAEDVAGN